jgi:hypothetical protein
MAELGDPGEALRLFLRSRGAVTALSGTRISVKLDSGDPSIRYSLAGGRAAWGEHDPLMLVECWGRANATDDGTAHRMAREVAEAVEGLRGSWGGCWVAGASVESGPSDSPDPQTSRPRALVTVRLQSYPLEAAV